MATNPAGGLDQALRQVAQDLEELKAPFALLGGLAVSAIATPRFTRDIDLALAAPDDTAAETLIHQLGYPVEATVEQSRAGRLATARLRGPNAVAVDLLFASSGIEDLVVAQARPLEILPGLILPVARPGHLLALKVLARDDRRRPQDADDLRALLAEASPAELAAAGEALDLIASRGFHRRRNLRAAWERARALSSRRA